MSLPTTDPNIVRHNAGKCPACRAILWMEVEIEVNTNPPTLDDQGRAKVHAYARAVAATLSHDCDEREPVADWERELLMGPPA